MTAARCLIAAFAWAIAGPAQAQTIYPINRAEVLAGSRFDLKVEFPEAPAADAVRVTINGIKAAALVGRPASFVQREEGDKKGVYVPNEKYCGGGALRRVGNLPFGVSQGVHAADDVMLTATGPGAEMFHGRLDNTRVFRVMATALGLGPTGK